MGKETINIWDKLGVTQLQLANELNVTPSSVYRWNKENKVPFKYHESIIRFGKLLNKKISHLDLLGNLHAKKI